jgi:hypothetical protein
MPVLFPDPIEAVDYSVVQDKMNIIKIAGAPYEIQADIQPGTSEDEGITFVNDGQGRQEIGIVKIYSNTKLKVAKEGTTGTGTVVTWEGLKWEVFQELPYQKNSFFTLVDHYKYAAQLRTEGELT